MEIAARLRADHPTLPAGVILAADAEAASGAVEAAIELYRKALEMEPRTDLVIKITRLYESLGSPEQARGALLDWLSRHPDDVVARLTLATSLHTGGDADEAIRHYEGVLTAQPGNVVALNNLAWLYHQQDDVRALDFARQAYELLPDRAEIADTYGWLLVETGKVEQGITLLEKAVEQAPDNPDIRYHWAAGLAKAGDKTLALAELRELLGAPGPFSERAAAQALLEDLSD
jgi:tetratricopeptide (TPR) repeat protein